MKRRITRNMKKMKALKKEADNQLRKQQMETRENEALNKTEEPALQSNQSINNCDKEDIKKERTITLSHFKDLKGQIEQEENKSKKPKEPIHIQKEKERKQQKMSKQEEIQFESETGKSTNSLENKKQLKVNQQPQSPEMRKSSNIRKKETTERKPRKTKEIKDTSSKEEEKMRFPLKDTKPHQYIFGLSKISFMTKIREMSQIKSNETEYTRKEEKIRVEEKEDLKKKRNEIGMNQILQLFNNGLKCEDFIGFSIEEFKDIVEYSTNCFVYDKKTNWVKPVSKRIKRKETNISFEMKLFIIITYIKKYPPFSDLFHLMKLERFFSNKNPSKTARNIIINIMTETNIPDNLYDSLVNTFYNQSFETLIPLSSGYSRSYRYTIPELFNSFYIVDGRHQKVPRKYLETNGYNTDYYSYKHHAFGVKTLAFVDANGFCVKTTQSYPAADHDTKLFRNTFDNKMIPNGTFVIGDTGFLGCPRVIHPYRREKTNKSINNTFCSYCYKLLLDGRIINKNNNQKSFSELCEIVFYGVIEVDKKINFCEFEIIEEEGVNYYIMKGCCACSLQNNSFFELKCTSLLRMCTREEIMNYYEEDKTQLSSKYNIGFFEILRANVYGEMDIDGTNDNTFHGSVVIPNDLIVIGHNSTPETIKIYNHMLSSIRQLVENYFGREILLFRIAACEFRNDLGLYDNFMKVVVSLTNYHVHLHPLRRFPFFVFYRSHKHVFTLDEKTYLVKRIPISKNCQKLLKLITGDCSDFKYLEDFFAKLMRKSINTRGTNKINTDWELEKLDLFSPNNQDYWNQIENEEAFIEKEVLQQTVEMMKASEIFDKLLVEANDTLNDEEIRRIFGNEKLSNENSISSSQKPNETIDLNEGVEKSEEIIKMETIDKHNEMNLKNTTINQIDFKRKHSENSYLGQINQNSLQFSFKRNQNNYRQETQNLSDLQKFTEHNQKTVPLQSSKKQKMEKIDIGDGSSEYDNDFPFLNENNQTSFYDRTIGSYRLKVPNLNNSQTGINGGNEENNTQTVLDIVEEVDIENVQQLQNNNNNKCIDVDEIEKKELNLSSVGMIDYGNGLREKWCHTIVFDCFIHSHKKKWLNFYQIVPIEYSTSIIQNKRIENKKALESILTGYENRQIIIFICNINNVHWTCVCLESPVSKLYIIDSLRVGSDEKIKNDHINLIEFVSITVVKKTIEIEVLKVKNQKGFWECGYRVMHFIKRVCSDDWGTYVPLEKYYTELSFEKFLNYLEPLYEAVTNCERLSVERKTTPFKLFCDIYSDLY